MPHKTVYWDDVEEGQHIPTMIKQITATTIVAGAIAFRDFNPLHHDRDFAVKHGAPDIYMGVQVTSAWASKYLTKWSGPEGELKRLEFSLEAPCLPGATLTWSGRVIKKYFEGDQHLVAVEYTATVPIGTHCSGTATMALPIKDDCLK
jgi:acyl dehydratase